MRDSDMRLWLTASAEGEKQFHLAASARTLGNRRGEVTIYSEIYPYSWGSDDPTVTSNKFLKELNSLEDVDEITVKINSPGGIVSEAIAIRTNLMKHPAKKIIDIEGCCDSAATLIACMPGARVRMAKGGEYMIHRCSGGARGNADKMLSAYNSMMQTDKDMADIYAERTGKTAEECLKLMTAETWYGAEEAMEAGFVDEIITAEGEMELAACAADNETMALMRACYAHAPERPIREARAPEAAGAEDVSNGSSAVAADTPTENKNKGVKTNMDELKNATAEQLATENPTATETIRKEAIEAERKRVEEIDALTPPGADYAEMARKAKADGTTAADFLKGVIAKQREASKAYLEQRKEEGMKAGEVGGGDAGDNDKGDLNAMRDKEAKMLAEMADGIDDSTIAMA